MTAQEDPAKMTAAEAQAAFRDVKDVIIENALDHVAFDGWSWTALKRGAEDAGYDADRAKRAFSGGLRDAALHFADWADRKMLERLEEIDLDSMRVRDRVAMGVRVRLENLAPHRESIRRLLSFMALPQNAPYIPKMTWRTCDHIWWAAGDRSADFNHYTKRGLLAPVYSATLLYWLEDGSEDLAGTWDFLDRRIADVMKIPGYQAKVKKALTKLPNPLSVAKRFRPRMARRRSSRVF